uniref:Family with sequence similarity 113 n=1 Tax=Latimeria chalumnae TaxID=7897 RepID=H3AR84_LATCH
QKETKLLLHNKFVVILGDSIQRSVYKDLVVLLQKNALVTQDQLKSKGETSFEHDFLVESGEQTNGTGYREVRQYCTDHHLVRFYFLTRVYSEYVESVLSDFQAGPQPDVLIINSCIWDISRYGSNSMREYKSNLKKFFSRLDNILLPECLVIWNLAMPLSSEINGGFLTPKLHHLGLGQKLPFDVIAANFYSATMADSYKFDVLDLHYHFRFELQNRVKDGIHWNPIAHRQISNLLLSHIAEAWSVEVPSV